VLAEVRPSVSVGGIEALLKDRLEPRVTLLSAPVGTTGPLVHSSIAESSAPASDGGHEDRLRKPLLVDLWGAGGRVPASLSLSL
jgi:hypothetical protein